MGQQEKRLSTLQRKKSDIEMTKMDRGSPNLDLEVSGEGSSFSSSLPPNSSSSPMPEADSNYFSSPKKEISSPTSQKASPHSSSPFPFLPSSTKKWLKDKENGSGDGNGIDSIQKTSSSGNVTPGKKKKSTPTSSFRQSSPPYSPPVSPVGEDTFFLPVAHWGNSSRLLKTHNHLLSRCLIDHLLSCASDCQSSFSTSSPSPPPSSLFTSPFSTSSPSPTPSSPSTSTNSSFSTTESPSLCSPPSTPPSTPPFTPSPYPSPLANSPSSPSSPFSPPASPPPSFLDPTPQGWERKIDTILEIHSNPLAVLLASLEVEMAFDPHLAAVMRERTISVRCLQYLCGDEGAVGERLDGAVGPLKKFVTGLGKGKVAILDGRGEGGRKGEGKGKKKKKEEKKEDGRRGRLRGKLVEALWQVLNFSVLPPILSVICYEATILSKKWYPDFGKEMTSITEGEKGKGEGEEVGEEEKKEEEGVQSDAWAEWAVGAILLLRCLVPRIASKKNEGKKSGGTGGSSGMALSETRRGEILISKFLIRLCSGTPFPNESCLLNEILEEVRPQFFVFCGEVIQRGKELSSGGCPLYLSPHTRKGSGSKKSPNSTSFGRLRSARGSIPSSAEEEGAGGGKSGVEGGESGGEIEFSSLPSRLSYGRKRSSTDSLADVASGRGEEVHEGEGQGAPHSPPYDSRGRSASLLSLPSSGGIGGEEGEGEGAPSSPPLGNLRNTPSNPYKASTGEGHGGEDGGELGEGWGGGRRKRVSVVVPYGLPSFLMDHREVIDVLLKRMMERDIEMEERREQKMGAREGGKGGEVDREELLQLFIHCLVPETGVQGLIAASPPDKRRRERK